MEAVAFKYFSLPGLSFFIKRSKSLSGAMVQNCFWGALIFVLSGFMDFSKSYGASRDKFPLARNGSALVSVSLPKNASATEQFAASELTGYLKKICGAAFPIVSGEAGSKGSIILQKNNQLQNEEYSISAQGQNLILSAGSGRAMLYAVYDFLNRLGCRWLAPQFAFYKGQSEFVPDIPDLVYETSNTIIEKPRFPYRKLDIEEGRSHTIENLKQIIDWMPKVRLNILMVPLNYQGGGKVMWDNWRKELTADLEKRELLIEVGGHGYQNFLNAKMQNGDLFTKHPDWFGKNRLGNPDPAENLVFNTSNRDAVKFFISNIVGYIRQHPEIDIFDFWPPDVARWAETPDMAALGTAEDRQASLVNEVNDTLKSLRPDLRIEIIAYGQVLQQPRNIKLNPDILVDICPINQTFEKPIFDTSHANNKVYSEAISNWRHSFSGDIGLYSYYRKYAWRSLPLILPHYMQKEMQWYAKLPLQAISTYAEPADWFTYELNHYTLAALAWNPFFSVDSIMHNYCRLRYGHNAVFAQSVYAALEIIVPRYCSIPYTITKSREAIGIAISELINLQKGISSALAMENDEVIVSNLDRLFMMLKYAASDLEILQQKFVEDHDHDIELKVNQLVKFLEQNAHKGVFLTGKNDLNSYLKHYSIK